MEMRRGLRRWEMVVIFPDRGLTLLSGSPSAIRSEDATNSCGDGLVLSRLG